MSRFSAPDPGRERRVGALDLPIDAADELVTLLERAAGPADEAEREGETAAVSAFVAQRVERAEPARPGLDPHPPHRCRRGHRGCRPRRRSGRCRCAAGSAQRWVSRALGVVGIDVPSPDSRRLTATPSPHDPGWVGVASPASRLNHVPHRPRPLTTGLGPATGVPRSLPTMTEVSGPGTGRSSQWSPSQRARAAKGNSNGTSQAMNRGNGDAKATANGNGSNQGNGNGGNQATAAEVATAAVQVAATEAPRRARGTRQPRAPPPCTRTRPLPAPPSQQKRQVSGGPPPRK